jgi:hypothetical protein
MTIYVIAVGGARYRGVRARTGVNEDPMLQPDEKLRALNSQPSQGGAREEVYCTKIGVKHPAQTTLGAIGRLSSATLVR